MIIGNDWIICGLGVNFCCRGVFGVLWYLVCVLCWNFCCCFWFVLVDVFLCYVVLGLGVVVCSCCVRFVGGWFVFGNSGWILLCCFLLLNWGWWCYVLGCLNRVWWVLYIVCCCVCVGCGFWVVVVVYGVVGWNVWGFWCGIWSLLISLVDCLCCYWKMLVVGIVGCYLVVVVFWVCLCCFVLCCGIVLGCVGFCWIVWMVGDCVWIVGVVVFCWIFC